MRFRRMELSSAVFVCVLGLPALRADEPAADASAERITAAVKRGLPLVTAAAERYPTHRKCFSCHHQTLPMLAMVTARDAGIESDDAVLKSQAEFTHKSFTDQLKELGEGQGIGGRALTVGYGLLSLGLADWPADETTAAMVTFLLKTQQDDGHWKPQTSRPPMEDSSETTTAIAVAGLRRFGPADAASPDKHQIDAAIEKAKTWLIAAQPKSTEDKAARLWGLRMLESPEQEIEAARSTLLAAQRGDGGWPQLDTMESDAYATGQTLYVLVTTGYSPASPECRRAVEFLLDTQQDDGSWFVKSRSDPVQVIFNNGDPHDTDQFISTPASGWALAALAACKK
jgi:N-acyl-D-amino-acid deacylase